MAAKPEDLNWIVIARRAVVRKKIDYKDAALAWKAQLEKYRDVLKKWYGGTGAFTFDAALGLLQGWIDKFFGTPAAAVDAARTAPSTIDLSAKGYPPRLWKGPLRVAHEEAGTTISGAPTLDDKKTITNADAVLRAGDVIEFPLHALLAACGLSAYAGGEFDPAGSFLLSTSVKGLTPASAPLHDNAAAMRFQLILALGRGAFCAAKEVFERVSSMPAPYVKDDAVEAWARGMVYAATLRGPHASRMKGSDGWEIEDYGWGKYEDKKAGTADDEANLPTFVEGKNAHPAFKADQPITPGWTCSPMTLTVSQYIIGDKAGTIFSGGVRDTVQKKATATSPIKVHYEYTEPKDFLKDPTLEKQVTDTTTAIDALRKRLTDALADLSPARELETAKTEGKISAAVLKKIQPLAAGKQQEEKKLADTIHKLLNPKKAKDALPEAEAAALVAFHVSWLKRVAPFPTGALPPIKNDGTWASLGQKAPDPKVGKWPAACATEDCKDAHGGMDQVRDARKALEKALKGLPESGANAVGFAGRSSFHGDFSDSLGFLNVVVMDGHEYAYAKFWPAEELAKAPALPRSWKPAAYDPLTGNPFVVESKAPANGQLYVLDASGQLFYHSERHNVHLMTVRPWVVALVNNNKLMVSYVRDDDDVKAIKKVGKDLYIGEYADIYGGKKYLRHKPFDAMHRMRPGSGDDVGDAYLSSARYADLAWKKVYVKLDKVKVSTMDEWYGDRAVPFPTLEEVVDEFPKASEVRALNAKLAAEIYKTPRPTDAEIAAASKGAYFHPWALAYYLDSTVQAPPKPAATPPATTTPPAAPPANTTPAPNPLVNPGP
jgi:hypothetical protein